MSETNATPNIYQRINAVRKMIGYVQRDKTVSTGGGSYKAVTHDAVTGMVRAGLIEHGIVIVPALVSHIFNQKEPEAKQRLYEATYRVAFVNIDDPQDKVDVDVSAHALDNGDKAPGKAMSYAANYAILKVFSIETGEDDESLYQTEEFVLAEHVGKLRLAGSLKDLKDTFDEALEAAKASPNRREDEKELISAKNARKGVLEAAK